MVRGGRHGTGETIGHVVLEHLSWGLSWAAFAGAIDEMATDEMATAKPATKSDAIFMAIFPSKIPGREMPSQSACAA